MVGQTPDDAGKSNATSMKVTPYYSTQEVLVECFLLEEDTVSGEFAIEDKNTVKHKSPSIEDTMVVAVVTVPGHNRGSQSRWGL